MILQSVARRSDALIVHNELAAQTLAKHFPWAASKTHIIAFGVPEVSGIAPQKKPVVLGFFGFITPHKKLETALQALTQLSPDFSLLVAGGLLDNSHADYLESLKAFCRSNRLESRVTWLGFVPNEKIKEVFEKIDFAVLPYENVTESAVLHLALGHQKIVLTSKAPAFEAFHQKNQCTVLFSNANELASQIKRLSQNPRQAKELLESVKKFNETHSYSRFVSEHLALYQKILGEA